MKKKISRALLASLIALSASFSLQAAPQSFTLDENHSYVLWRAQHMGFSPQVGKWFVSGSLLLDKEQVQNSKVTVNIDMEKINTGLPEFDNHLKSPQFFDVARFPKATFVSDKVEVLSPTTAKVSGILTFRGVSKPVTLMVTFNKQGNNVINKKFTVGFTATTKIKRSDFGMNALIPNVSDEVEIDIGAEAFESKGTQ